MCLLSTGTTIDMQVEPREFYNPDEIVKDVRRKVADTARGWGTIDELTFVPDGPGSYLLLNRDC